MNHTNFLATPLPKLSICLLGNFQLMYDAHSVPGLDVPRMQSLLAYLLLHSSGPQSRSHLAYQLWQDSTDAQAHTNLRNMIHKLRQTLPDADSFLHIDRQVISWRPQAPWTLDVLDFEKAIAEAEQGRNASEARQALAKAVKLYQGDLLPSCYDEWILPERDRLRHMFLDALERLILLQEQERDYDAAIRSAQLLLHHDQLHEATYRHLIRLNAVNGNRAAALRTYHNCVTVLERELGVKPSKATREIYEHLLKNEEASDEPKLPHPMFMATVPFVGRQAEWSQLQRAWHNARAGQPHFFLLSGEAGIGKTRLAEELLTWVGRQGIATAVARCYAAEGELAYAPVVSWLRSDALQSALSSLADIWLTEVARLLPHLLLEKPELPRPNPLIENWQRQRLFEALAHAILQRKQPLLLLLDDVQWCDRETLEWLHYLLRFDQRAPLLVIGTMRSEEVTSEHVVTSLLLSLRRDALVTEIELDALTAAETAYLAAHLTEADLDTTTIAAVYQETEGNPLFVVETVRAGAVEKARKGHLSHTAPPAQPGVQLPPTVQAVIASRLAQLSPTAREVMNLAAVIGRAFTFDLLVQTSSIDEDTLVQGLDELWQRRIVREQGGDAYDFSHEKLREQAYVSLSTARRRLLHRRIGDALQALHVDEALDAVSGQIAVHYEQAGAFEQAIVYYGRAAEVAQQVYANEEALTIYRRVLRLLGLVPLHQGMHEWRRERTIQCHEHMGDVLMLIGAHEEARNAYQGALALIPTQKHIQQAELWRKVAKTCERQHQYEEALHAYTAAEDALGPEPSPSVMEWWQEWIELQDGKLDLYGLLARMDVVAELVEKMRPIVQQYGTPIQRAEFFFSSALTASRIRNFVTTAQDLAEAQAGLAAYEALGNRLKIGWGHLSLSYLYLSQDSLVEAEEHVRKGLAVGENTGDAMMQVRALSYLVLTLRKRGKKDEVKQLALKALPMAEMMHQHVLAGLNKANLAWVALHEGNLSEASVLGRAAVADWHSLEVVYYYSQWTARLPLLNVALDQEQLSEAIDHARQLLAPGQQRLPDELVNTMEAAVQAWDAEQFDSARSHLRQAIVVAREKGYL